MRRLVVDVWSHHAHFMPAHTRHGLGHADRCDRRENARSANTVKTPNMLQNLSTVAIPPCQIGENLHLVDVRQRLVDKVTIFWT